MSEPLSPWVVVVGSVNVDLVVVAHTLPRAGETVLGDDLVRHGGGKGANAAVAAARFGAPTMLIAAVGDDEFGQWSRNLLSGDGVEVGGVICAPRPTGAALIIVDRRGENQIAVASGANAWLSADVVTALAAAIGGETKVGCVLLSAEVPTDALAAAARWGRTQGATIVLNPAPMRADLVELAGQVDVVTPNETELGMLAEALGLAGDADAAAVAARLGTAIAMTHGGEGVVLAVPGAVSATVPALRVEVVDTTGAGDTFNGVLAAGLAGGRSVTEAAGDAVAAASLSVTEVGARAGMPNAAAVAAARGA